MQIVTLARRILSQSRQKHDRGGAVPPISVHQHPCDPGCPALTGQGTSRCSRAMAAGDAATASLNRTVGRSGFLRALGTVAGAAAIGGVAGPVSSMLSPVAGALAAGKSKLATSGKGLWLGNARNLTPAQALSYVDPGSGDPALLMRLANGQYVSYDAGCTHGACTVAYDTTRRLMVCPCHGATFDPARGAAVVVGPAKDPLYQLPVRVDAAGDVYYLAAPPGPMVNRLKKAPPYTGQTGDDGGDGGGEGGDAGNNRIRRLRPSKTAGRTASARRAASQHDS
jgi:Rieske Fe-S protein